ncbi:hypothetical protein DJ030_12685 [bacterium endosymbiont of Escarpia laminata]|nr:MAG: hypothetical protein DJ031_12245 [bacterium endosymbiont of Escarpia laminata]RLJ18235.1 MAG: hypothetical protein DJ030_12685 [bacterium endosymbiont of Escarpia laminata]
MKNVILTANLAKSARIELHLSQGKVAGDLDISRTYLSQFENGRYLFDDGGLTRLREYYEEAGYEFPDQTFQEALEPIGLTESNEIPRSPQVTNIQVIDGFVIPGEMDREEAEALLAEYAENTRRIQRACSCSVKPGVLFGIDEGDQERKEKAVLLLMSRNYTLIERLHGHDTIAACCKSEKATHGDYLSDLFAKALEIDDEAA